MSSGDVGFEGLRALEQIFWASGFTVMIVKLERFKVLNFTNLGDT